MDKKQLRDYLAEVSYILNYFIPITTTGFKKMAKKNVTSYHSTSPEFVEKMIDLQNRKDVILPTFTHWDNSMVEPTHGVNTEGGIVFELTGDLLFASGVDMFSQQKNKATWIPLLKLERFQLMVDEAQIDMTDFTKYLVDTQRTVLDVAMDIVKPKLGDFKDKSNSEILDFLRAQVLEISPGTNMEMAVDEIPDAKQLFKLIKPIVDQFKKEFNEYIKHEKTLWSGFLDETLMGNNPDELPNNEMLVTNFTITKLYMDEQPGGTAAMAQFLRRRGAGDIEVFTEDDLIEKLYGN